MVEGKPFLNKLWTPVFLLALFYTVLELYYFYLPPPLITQLPEYGFPDLMGYVYKMLLLAALLWISLENLRSESGVEGIPYYSMLSLGTLGIPLAIRMTQSVYSYTNYTAVFTLLAIVFAYNAYRKKEPLGPRSLALAASLLGFVLIAFPTITRALGPGGGEPGLDALAAFLTLTPLTIVASITYRGTVGSWALHAAYGLLALATAGYVVVASPLPGALENPLASASLFVALQSLSLLQAAGSERTALKHEGSQG